jgi:hypothetical protein
MGIVNTIDEPGKKFRPAFSLAPGRVSGITPTAFLRFVINISQLYLIIKDSKKVKDQVPPPVQNIQRCGRSLGRVSG